MNLRVLVIRGSDETDIASFVVGDGFSIVESGAGARLRFEVYAQCETNAGGCPAAVMPVVRDTIAVRQVAGGGMFGAIARETFRGVVSSVDTRIESGVLMVRSYTVDGFGIHEWGRRDGDHADRRRGGDSAKAFAPIDEVTKRKIRKDDL